MTFICLFCSQIHLFSHLCIHRKMYFQNSLAEFGYCQKWEALVEKQEDRRKRETRLFQKQEYFSPLPSGSRGVYFSSSLLTTPPTPLPTLPAAARQACCGSSFLLTALALGCSGSAYTATLALQPSGDGIFLLLLLPWGSSTSRL